MTAVPAGQEAVCVDRNHLRRLRKMPPCRVQGIVQACRTRAPGKTPERVALDVEQCAFDRPAELVAEFARIAVAPVRPWTQPGIVLLGRVDDREACLQERYTARIVGGEMRMSDESTAIRFVDPRELGKLPMHQTQRLRLHHFLEGRVEPYLG